MGTVQRGNKMNVKFRNYNLPVWARFGIALLCYVFAAVFQALFFRGNDILWAVILTLLVYPVWLLRTGSKPGKSSEKKAAGKTDTWKPVTLTEVDRLRTKLQSIRKVKTSDTSYLLFCLLMTFAFFTLAIITAIFTGIVGFCLVIELYIIFIPFIWLARLDGWNPQIADSIEAFKPILNAVVPDELQLSPLLHFDGSDGMTENSLPADIRVMLAPGEAMPRNVRDELLGAQFQLSYNTGPNGKVPYIYAVFITKGKGKIWQTLKETKVSNYKIESSSSEEGGVVYGTVVLRNGGYHTAETDVKNLFTNVVIIMKGKW